MQSTQNARELGNNRMQCYGSPTIFNTHQNIPKYRENATSQFGQVTILVNKLLRSKDRDCLFLVTKDLERNKKGDMNSLELILVIQEENKQTKQFWMGLILTHHHPHKRLRSHYIWYNSYLRYSWMIHLSSGQASVFSDY